MSDDLDCADRAPTDISATELSVSRKQWSAPKVIVSSFGSTAVKKGAQPIDTPRPGTGTTQTATS